MIPVCAHVSVQVPGLREASITDLTLVRFFSSVCPVVLREGGAVGETFAACVTLVGTVPGVGAQMGGDGRALREPALAHRTFERFFSTVRSQVGREIGRLREGFLADGALVGFFSVVRAEVRLERGLPRVRLTADVARVVPRKGIPSTCPHAGAARKADGRRRGVVHRAIGLLRVRRSVEGAGYVHRRVGVDGAGAIVTRVICLLRTQGNGACG